jgi:hypothetical protein
VVDKGSLRVFFDNGRSNSELHYTTNLYNLQRLRCQLFCASFCGDLHLSLRPGDREPGPLTHPRADCLRFWEGAQLLSASTQNLHFLKGLGWITATRKLDLSFRFVQHRRDSRRDPLRPRSRNLISPWIAPRPKLHQWATLLRTAYPYKRRDEANYVVMRVSIS